MPLAVCGPLHTGFLHVRPQQGAACDGGYVQMVNTEVLENKVFSELIIQTEPKLRAMW